MKKILSILMVAVMVLSLAACGTKDREEAEKTLNEFMKAFSELDTKAMKDYLDDEEAVSNFEDAIEAEVANMMGELPAMFDGYEEDFEEIVIDFVERYVAEASYEIKEVEEDKDEYTFTIEFTLPDPSSVDFEEEFLKYISEEEIKQLVQNEVSAGNLTEYSTEKEVYKVIMPKLISVIKEAFEGLEIEDMETEETEEEIVVVKTDGKWLIDAKASDLT